jgi:PAS domain S-box-containing protein
MKIKKQFFVTMIFFFLSLLLIITSMVVSIQQSNNLNNQKQIAQKIQIGASDLNYISTDFFLFQENIQLEQWQLKITLISNEIMGLTSTNNHQQILVDNVKADLKSLQLVFKDAVTFLENAPRNSSVRILPAFQTTWSRLIIQNQALAYDSSLLVNSVNSEFKQLNFNNTLLIFAVFSLFSAYFITNYLITYRRTLKAVSALQAGAVIIGSGNLEYKINADKKDEIGELSTAFNQMTTNLKAVTSSQAELIGEITQRKIAEENLRSTSQYLDNLLNYANAPIVVWDNEKNITLFNNAFAAFTGYNKESMLRENIEMLFPASQKTMILENIGKASLGEKWASIEVPILCKDGKTRIALWNSANVTDKEGKIVATIAQGQDITERKETEEKLIRTMDQLVLVNEKLGVVGSLTRHDVGNKLMVVKSNVYLLKKQIGDNPKLAKYLEGIDSAIISSDKLFEFSRIYEKIGVEKPSKENIFECFNQAAALLPNLGTTIKIVNDCHGLEVMADSLLKQLFYNFLDNSLKHGEKVTQIHLHYTKDGEELKLFYEDNGLGVPVANKSKLFDSGFTTGNGSGLGLYLIKKMMDVYGWTITETGEVSKGVCFVITIPKLNKNGKDNYTIT